MKRLSKLFKRSKLTAEKEAQLSQTGSQPPKIADPTASQSPTVEKHDAGIDGTDIEPLPENDIIAPGGLSRSSGACTPVSSNYPGPVGHHQGDNTKKASLVNLPRDIHLEIADVQDLSRTDFASLRRVHRNLTDIYTPKTFGTLRVHLSALVGDPKKQRSLETDRSGSTDHRRRGTSRSPLLRDYFGRVLKTPERVLNLIEDSIGMRGARENTHTLILEGQLDDHIVIPYAAQNHTESKGSGIFEININMLSDLLSTLNALNLKTVKLLLNVRLCGEKVAEDIISLLSTWSTRSSCNFVIDVTLRDFPDFCSLKFLKNLSFVRALRIYVWGYMGISSYAISTALYSTLCRSDSITHLSIDIPLTGPDTLDRVSPIIHLLRAPLQWTTNLKRLEIIDREQGLHPVVWQLQARDVDLLKGLEEIAMYTEHGFWDLFAKCNIYLSKVTSCYMDMPLMMYISNPIVASTLKVLNLSEFKWSRVTSPVEMQQLGTLFKDIVVPNICNTIEELKLQPVILNISISNLLNERKYKQSFLSQMLTPLSASEWVGNHIFKSLKKLDAYLLIKGANKLNKLGTVLERYHPFRWPKANSLHLQVYWITWPGSQYNLHTLDYFRDYLKYQKYHDEEKRFRNFAELALEVAHGSFKAGIADRIWYSNLEYFFSGNMWHPRCP